MKALSSKLILVTAMTGGLALAGCTTAPYGNNGNYDRGYQSQSNGYGDRNVRCQTCGVVQDVQQVRVEGSGNGGTLGAIIGAVAGGVLGNQVGKGDGRKAATVAGAVAGGVVGNQVGKRHGEGADAWRIVVRLDNGQYATVTQRENPGIRNGDYVEVRGDHVYPR
ncbi:glycine zipper 2TM domain-containing protein [Rhodanobacter sp. T12-5]|uniref:glycine zipper 2TM domain-containing protein n=1 Tax=Rhodanobacter sp. T12-5 TaxID=2024611 RepID=UPI0011EBC855|nr:glycine zipper 2TM domain-containing protein [Rhodanobacter sp. T12-5]KAA0071218.1 glycine zipper 2TM domain-containing protein [Rhodanobacter sp. T12-5]HTH69104.1 glycine zipper 2TM domain-containing protein [Rhodanobacter sp.]